MRVAEKSESEHTKKRTQTKSGKVGSVQVSFHPTFGDPLLSIDDLGCCTM
jgi:hypothetical protein